MSIFNKFNSSWNRTVPSREGDDPVEIKLITETKAEYGRARTYETKEPETLEWMRRYFKPGDHFWDIGANIGGYSLFAARLGAMVYAFEPHAINAARLLENVELNELRDRISLYPIAVGKTEGLGKLFVTSLDVGSSLHEFKYYEEFFDRPKVPAYRPYRQGVVCFNADGLVMSHHIPEPTHIKIDTDGNEGDVLKGMHRLLYTASGMKDEISTHPFQGRLKTVLVECHDDNIGPIRGLMRTYNFTEDDSFPETSRRNLIFTNYFRNAAQR